MNTLKENPIANGFVWCITDMVMYYIFYKYMNSYFSITLWIQKTFKMSSTHWAGLTHLQTRQSRRLAQFAMKNLRIQA